MFDKRIENLKPYDLNCNVFNVYDYDGLTLQELLSQFFTKINECIDITNKNSNLGDFLLNEGLEKKVVEKLLLWLEDGTLDNIINVNVFNNLSTQINNIEKSNRRFLSDNKTRLIAHRGCWMFSPENTHESIIDAKKYGYDFVELDINRTVDNQYILMHDTTVDRTTNGTGLVSALPINYIKSLNVNPITYNEDKVFKVPTFEESVKLCSELKLGINLDCSKIWFNEQTIHDVVLILKKYSMFENTFFVISDNARELITSLYPDVFVTWLSNKENLSEAIKDIEKYKNAFISYDINNFNESMAIELHRYNIKFFLHGCNNDYNFKKALSYNPIFIETDNQIILKGEL